MGIILLHFRGHWLGPYATSTLGHGTIVEETIAVHLEESARIRQQLLAVLGTQDIFFFFLFDIHVWKKKVIARIHNRAL